MAYSNTQINNWIDEVKASMDADNHWHKQRILHWLNQRINGHIDDINFQAGLKTINNSGYFMNTDQVIDSWTADKIVEILNA